MRRNAPYSPPGGPSWGAPPDGFDPASGQAHEAAPTDSKGRPGGLLPTTRVLGWLLVAFAFLTASSRWLQVEGTLAMWRVSSQTRDAIAEVAAINAEYAAAAGISPEALMPVDASAGVLGLALPTLLAGVGGLAAAALVALTAMLILVRSRRAPGVGTRGLLLATLAITLAHAADLWAARKVATAARDQMQQVSARVGQQAAAMFDAVSRMTEAAIPSFTSQLVGVLIWLVPSALFLLWGARHLRRPEVASVFGDR